MRVDFSPNIFPRAIKHLRHRVDNFRVPLMVEKNGMLSNIVRFHWRHSCTITRFAAAYINKDCVFGREGLPEPSA